MIDVQENKTGLTNSMQSDLPNGGVLVEVPIVQTAKSSKYSSRNTFFVQSLIIMGAMNYGSSGWKDCTVRDRTVGGGSMVGLDSFLL